MAYLFNFDNKVILPNTETLLISPFKEIWERDTSKNKELALSELTYIEFMTSVKKTNPYRQYPESLKSEVLIKDIIKNKDWQPDELIVQGISKVQEFQKNGSTSYSYYLANKIAIEKTIEFFNTELNYSKLTKSGLPVYKQTEVVKTVKEASAVLLSLTNLSKKVEEELFENTKNKSNKSISPFAKLDNNELVISR